LIEDLRLKVGSVGQLDSFQLDKAYGNFRAFVDSAPVLDKAWAERAGLGWMGKNTCLIHPKIGSFVFIGEIITDLELEYDTSRVNDLCGGCNKCIEACPTDAIIAPYRLDARKCISYLTIEYKGELPVDEKPKFGDWIFGCDICQEVCPWNRSVKPGTVEAFKASDELKEMDKDRWGALSGEDFERLFRNSAVKRTRFEGLKRNIMFLTGGRGK
jgi:epoxyqueuosine reductase